MKRIPMLVLVSLLMSAAAIYAEDARIPSALSANDTGGLHWTRASFAAQCRCGRRALPIPEHREVAAVLGALIDGDAVLMFLEPRWCGSLALEDLLALRVTFAAQDAELRRVAWAVNLDDPCIHFVPRDPDQRVSLRLDQVALAQLLEALAELGEVTPRPPH